VTLRLEGDGTETLVDLIDDERSDAGRTGRHRVSLDAYGYRWLGIGRADAAPRRRTD